MHVKRIDIVKRQNGYFHLTDRKVKSYRKGDGYGVDVVFEASPLDCDLGNLPQETLSILNATNQEFHFFITAKDLKRIELLMDKSDNLTFQLLGHGWDHPERPFHKLEEFV
jgi:hypothetical protein